MNTLLNFSALNQKNQVISPAGFYLNYVAGLLKKSHSNVTDNTLDPITALISFRLWILFKLYVLAQFVTHHDKIGIAFQKSNQRRPEDKSG